MKEEELDLELPGDDDENVGDGAPKKKREKKRKSKEERMRERRIIFWTLLIILATTFLFWFVPKIGTLSMPSFSIGLPNKVNAPKQEMKNYVEYKL